MLSEAVQLALVAKLPELAIAAASIATSYLSYRTHKIAKKTEENTNHLKDELVAAVSKERFAAGQKQEADAQAANALFFMDDGPKEN